MTMLTQPRGGIPIGKVTINGRPFDVETNAEYLRFFTDLVRRAGGTSGTTLTDVSAIGLLSRDRATGDAEDRAQSVLSMRMTLPKQEPAQFDAKNLLFMRSAIPKQEPQQRFDGEQMLFIRSVLPKQEPQDADIMRQRVFARR